jgi:hypothetical protein
MAHRSNIAASLATLHDTIVPATLGKVTGGQALD